MLKSNNLPSRINNMVANPLTEILSYAGGFEGVIKLWLGEGHLPTPDFICREAIESLKRGETFYTFQRGIPRLREALRDYHNRLYGTSCDTENFLVTGSGMQAVTLALELVAHKNVAFLTPSWPNFSEISHLLGFFVNYFALQFDGKSWSLDLEKLFDFLKKQKIDTFFLNHPNNPCGWLASDEELAQIVAFCRHHGIWLIVDEVYTRYCFGLDYSVKVAPSVLQHCDDSDRVIVVNTFSKNWSMTGWRIGFMYVPTWMAEMAESAILYNTSGVPEFSQHAAVAALSDRGEVYLQEQIKIASSGFKTVTKYLEQFSFIDFQQPKSTFYFFMRVRGVDDSLSLAKDIVCKTKVGLAPGAAFGFDYKNYLRLCVLNDKSVLTKSMDLLSDYFGSRFN